MAGLSITWWLGRIWPSEIGNVAKLATKTNIFIFYYFFLGVTPEAFFALHLKLMLISATKCPKLIPEIIQL
jgi:hypothetical protein